MPQGQRRNALREQRAMASLQWGCAAVAGVRGTSLWFGFPGAGSETVGGLALRVSPVRLRPPGFQIGRVRGFKPGGFARAATCSTRPGGDLSRTLQTAFD
jgi:hypothetical protein